jgi:S-adenosylmethionine:tRNA ribosyltransferase-isomerase
MVKNAKKQKSGHQYQFADGTIATIVANPSDAGTEFRTLAFSFPITEDWFEANGHIPLPPYIRREDTAEDSQRYQNVYATETGSAACPTAGLHFTTEMLENLDKLGIQKAWVTLHVGLGTFLPVRAERLEDHAMHYETYSVSPQTAQAVNQAKAEGRPMLAVGTTSVGTLESAWNNETQQLESGTKSTNIFIYPGYQFKVVDKLFTNFHTPESTLLMLVSAFAGKERIMAAYQEAVEQRYRFFSYGDAMLIL